MWDLSSPTRGIYPASPTLKGKVLTTGQPRKSLIIVVFCISYFMSEVEH